MKSMKRLLSVVLAALMVLSMTAVALAEDISFTDTAGHWAWTRGYIPYLVEKDILNGYKQNDGTYIFKPDKEVTRAEFIKMLDETFGLLNTKKVTYSDVSESDWFYPYFAKAAAQGYILNYGYSANPNGELTREEAASLLVRYLNLPNEKASVSQFADYYSISNEYKDYILIAAKNDIIDGYAQNDGSFLFKPYKTLTRAEALTILYRAAGCIFNVNASKRDVMANADNNVITRGVTVSNVTMNGRNIVTEGAGNDVVTLKNVSIPSKLTVRGGSEIALDKCIAEEIVVENGAKITLANGAKIKKLTLNNGSAISMIGDTEIEDLYVGPTCKNLKITGSGKIGNATIYASGLVSSIVPEAYDIASGYTAMFDGKEYSGKSTDAAKFEVAPFVTDDGTTQFINLKASASGKVYFYYTNTSKAPEATEFNAAYQKNLDVADYANVTADKYETISTFKLAKISDYNYIVIQFRDSNTDYDPIVISAERAIGTGFKTAPALDTKDTIKFKAGVDGTVIAYYAESASAVTPMEFIKAYDAKESALKSSFKVEDGKTYTYTIESKYLKNYPNIIFMVIDADGLYYQPVVVATGDTGFSEGPAITTPGNITGKTTTAGTLYYYFTNDKTVPSAEQYYKEYQAATLRNKVAVDKKEDVTVKFTVDDANQYKYIVIAIKTADGWMQPVVIAIEMTIGFTKVPELTADGTVSFEANENGKIKYYYTKSAKAPTIEEFNETYDESKGKRGTVEFGKSNKYGAVEINPDLAAVYPYMILMFVSDKDKTEYTPVVVNLASTSTTVFTAGPSYKDGKISFKTAKDGQLYYFYDDSIPSVTASSYYAFWKLTNSQDRGIISDIKKDTAKSFGVDEAAVDRGAKYIILSFIDQASADKEDRAAFTTPVILKLEETGVVTGSGLSIVKGADNVKGTVDYDGDLFWYMTDDEANLPKAGRSFAACYDEADAGNCTLDLEDGDPFTINSKEYTYVVVCLRTTDGEYLTPVITEFEVNNSGLEGSATFTGDAVVWTGVAYEDGTVTSYVDIGAPVPMGSASSGKNVKKGTKFQVVLSEEDVAKIVSSPFGNGAKFVLSFTTAEETYDSITVYKFGTAEISDISKIIPQT